MLALQEWRREHICPMCGWPKEICQDPAAEFNIEVPAPTRCHVTTAMRRTQEDYRAQPGARPDGLLWSAAIRQ